MNLEAARRLEVIVRTSRPDLDPSIGSAAYRVSSYGETGGSAGNYYVAFRESRSHVELACQADWVFYLLDREWHIYVREVNADTAARRAEQKRLKNSDTLRYLNAEETTSLGGAAGCCACCGGPVEAILTIRTGYECFRGDWYLCLAHRYLNSELIRRNVVE